MSSLALAGSAATIVTGWGNFALTGEISSSLGVDQVSSACPNISRSAHTEPRQIAHTTARKCHRLSCKPHRLRLLTPGTAALPQSSASPMQLSSRAGTLGWSSTAKAPAESRGHTYLFVDPNKIILSTNRTTRSRTLVSQYSRVCQPDWETMRDESRFRHFCQLGSKDAKTP